MAQGGVAMAVAVESGEQRLQQLAALNISR
jgi:hypothetical protein